MSDKVHAEITIDAPREAVWKVVMDPERLGDWVTIHKRLLSADDGEPREGMAMRQCLTLRGASFKVNWTLTEMEPERLAVWQGRGPVGSSATTRYALSDAPGGGTRLEYENEFKAPGGVLGKAAGRVLVGGLPQKEADGSLQRLKHLLQQ